MTVAVEVEEARLREERVQRAEVVDRRAGLLDPDASPHALRHPVEQLPVVSGERLSRQLRGERDQRVEERVGIVGHT
jgi:hypothetical protein